MVAWLNKRFLFIFTLALISHGQPTWAQMDSDSSEFDPEVEAQIEDDGSPDPGFDPDSEADSDVDLGMETLAEPIHQPEAEMRTGGSDEVIFDWSKHQNATEVPHPYVQKGLLRITRDRAYIYRVDESEQKTAVQVRIGIYNPVNLTAPGVDGSPASSFADNYDQTDNPTAMFDWEWQAWKSPIGKWGLTAGAGIYVAQGNGHFAGSKNAQEGLIPEEIFTFAVVPVSVGAVYRLQIWRRQLFVPYGAAGGIAFAFGEFRDDNKAPKWGGVLGTYYAAGLAMSLSYFDSLARIQLDREYGINSVYLTAEYRGLISLNNNFDFGSDFINGGFLMEY